MSFAVIAVCSYFWVCVREPCFSSDEEKMVLFRGTLKVLAQYGEDVFKKEVKLKEEAIKAKVAARKAEEARAAEMAAQRALDKRATAKKLLAEAETLEKANMGHKT